MNVCDFFNGNYMKNEQKYDYEVKSGVMLAPIPVIGGGFIHWRIDKSIFHHLPVVGAEASHYNMTFEKHNEGHENYYKLVFPLSDLEKIGRAHV